MTTSSCSPAPTAASGVGTTGATGEAPLRAGRAGHRHDLTARLRPAPLLRLAAHPRGPALDRRARRPDGSQPDDVPLDLRARDGRAARRAEGQRGGADPGCASGGERVRRNRTRPKPGPRADPPTTELRGFGSRRESRRPDSNRGPLHYEIHPGDCVSPATAETWPLGPTESGHFCRVGDTLRDTPPESASRRRRRTHRSAISEGVREDVLAKARPIAIMVRHARALAARRSERPAVAQRLISSRGPARCHAPAFPAPAQSQPRACRRRWRSGHACSRSPRRPAFRPGRTPRPSRKP